MSDKKVYTCFCTDIIHEGHLNIINKAKELGSVTVGVLCDSEMVRYNRFPQKTVEEKIEMIKAIPGVDNVIVQNHIMYDEVVKELRPDYIVHGNNWSSPAMAVIKDNILGLLAAFLQFLKPGGTQDLGLHVVAVHLVGDHPLALVAVAVRDTDLRQKSTLDLPEIRQEIRGHIGLADVLRPGDPGRLALVIQQILVHEHCRLTASHLVIERLEAFCSGFVGGAENIGQLRIEQVDGDRLAGKSHLLGIIIDQIQSSTIVRLQTDQGAVNADAGIQDPPQQGISNHRIGGLVHDVITPEPALLRDHSILIRVDDRDVSPAIEYIQKIVFRPGVGHLPAESRDGLLEQVALEKSI